MKAKNRICFFSGDITRSGGTERVSAQIMNALCDDSDIFIASLVETNEKPFYHIENSIKKEALFDKNPSGIKQYFAIVRHLRKFLREEKIDLLDDIDTVLDAFSVSAVKGTGVRLVAWEHFNFYETMGTKIRMPIRRLFTRRADAVVTLTQEDMKYYSEAFGGKTRIEQIYNPIALPENPPEYDVHSKTIVSVGRLAHQKGFDYLVQAAELALAKHPDWQWLILGEGDRRPMLETMLTEKRLGNVRLVGKVGNVEEYLSEAALFVMTSRFEGFPLALVEAKAMGLPAVSFRCRTGPSELIRDGVNGFLIDCFDVEQMAEKICLLIEDSGKRLAFSQMALENAEKMDFSVIIMRWKELINSLILA